uniref:Uncharacterized protein n=1 Tax=Aegilops tauschii subsp. strangulata TaxID=200361 RepID=A0A453N3F8_AEGTS
MWSLLSTTFPFCPPLSFQFLLHNFVELMGIPRYVRGKVAEEQEKICSNISFLGKSIRYNELLSKLILRPDKEKL